MDMLEQLKQADLANAFFVLLLVIISVTFVVKAIKDFVGLFKAPKQWINQNDEDHQILMQVKGKLQDHLKYSENLKMEAAKNNAKINQKLDDLKNIVINDKVDNIRNTILDFSSALTERRRFYSHEQFEHVLDLISQYQKLVQDYKIINNKMQNSIQIINHQYQYRMIHGFQYNGNKDEKKVQ